MGKGIWGIIGEGLGKRTGERMGGMGIGGRGFGDLLGKDGGKDWLIIGDRDLANCWGRMEGKDWGNYWGRIWEGD